MMVDNRYTLNSFMSDLNRQCETKFSTYLRFEDCRIRIDSNSESVIRYLARYFRAFAQEPGCADITVSILDGDPPAIDSRAFTVCRQRTDVPVNKEAYLDLSDGRVVRNLHTGMMFLFGHHDHWVIGECERNMQQVINFIDDCFIEWRLARGGDLLHAAGVARDHRGLAIAGAPGKGKSTLALHLIDRGMDFISNDRLILDASLPGLRMYGIAKQLRTNPGLLVNHPQLEALLDQAQRNRLQHCSPEELWSLEERFDVDVEECFGPGRHVLLARLSDLVVVNWDHSAEPMRMNRIDLAKRDDLMGVVAKPPGVFHLAPVKPEVSALEIDRLCRLLAATPVYEITGGVDFSAAVEACLSLFDTMAHASSPC
jgi:HprK-related kinase B